LLKWDIPDPEPGPFSDERETKKPLTDEVRASYSLRAPLPPVSISRIAGKTAKKLFTGRITFHME
jgi:hypothetical protein